MQRTSSGLTGNDLQNPVLLHVGWKVPCSHVLLHDPHVGQFLFGENKEAPSSP